MSSNHGNIDHATVRDFGAEWRRFDQSGVSEDEMARMFGEYFAVFPWEILPPKPTGFDAGCGSGRWSSLVARRVGHLHCIDAAPAALSVARQRLAGLLNVTIHEASIDAMPLADSSMDFGYSLGVLHHLPDPEAGLAACVQKLKPGAPMLVYLYYAFDNRPEWYRALWQATNLIRKTVSKAPFWLKSLLAEIFAALIYFPLARGAALGEKLGARVDNWPLSAYRWRSFYSMRTDSLDKFGTRLEHRMTKAEIAAMMERCGLTEIRFSNAAPFWCAAGIKR
jgi:SAM-dependent methyltransferase